jgi:rubrerythrin
MAEKYSLSEVLQMAEAIERNGGKFYRQAAEMTKDATAKAVMLDLAAQEDQHEAFFARLRADFCQVDEAQWWDPDGEAAAYIRGVAETHVFNMTPDMTGLLASVQSARSVLQLALSFEKDTIAFFSALKGAVTEDNRAKVDVLIQEEVRHIHQLSQAIAAL